MSKLFSLPEWFPWNSEAAQFSGAHLHVTTNEGELDLVATLQPHPTDDTLFCLSLRNRVVTFFMPACLIKFIRRMGGPRSCFMLDLRRDKAAAPLLAT